MRARARLVAVVLALSAPVACVVGGEEAPGCQADDECEAGFVCRAGACFRYTTGQSPPSDQAPDAAGGDAATDALDAGDGA